MIRKTALVLATLVLALGAGASAASAAPHHGHGHGHGHYGPGWGGPGFGFGFVGGPGWRGRVCEPVFEYRSIRTRHGWRTERVYVGDRCFRRW